MEINDPQPEEEQAVSRRTFLKTAGFVVGAALAGGLTYEVVRPKPNYERSAEFSKAPDWQQNFAQMGRSTLDTNLWHYENSAKVPGYNREEQGYTDWRENVRIEPGIGLVIEAHKRDYRYPDDPEGKTFEYTSGRIDTRNSLSFEYGKLEAVMKMPRGEGTWPAFWLLSGNEVHTLNKNFTKAEREKQKFYLRNGEIDILEFYGKNPHVVTSTVHTYNGSSTEVIPVNDVTHSFHKYGVELTPDVMYLTFDDVPYHRFIKKSNDPNDWPFGNKNELYPILNLAMGGKDKETIGAINDADEAGWRLEVADISFYDYTGNR